MKINSIFSKLAIISSILLLTYFYAQYEKNKYFSSENAETENLLVLKHLPNFDSIEVSTGKTINSTELLKQASGLFIHIWGSWCGPCEAEMPEFLKYAESTKDKGLKFLLVGVNEQEIQITKFMNRFKVPGNVIVTIDKTNVVMDLFGVLKVPETFLFDKNGKHSNKFSGPQNWLQPSLQSRIGGWINSENSSVQHKIETH